MRRTGAIPQWTLSDRLTKARESAGLSQDELAGQLGISRQSVSNYERGYAKIKRATTYMWADLCGVDRHWLFWGEPPPDDPDGSAPDLSPDELALLPRLDSNQQPFAYPVDGRTPTAPGRWVDEFRKQLDHEMVKS